MYIQSTNSHPHHEHGSPPITTRPGLPPSVSHYFITSVYQPFLRVTLARNGEMMVEAQICDKVV